MSTYILLAEKTITQTLSLREASATLKSKGHSSLKDNFCVLFSEEEE